MCLSARSLAVNFWAAGKLTRLLGFVVGLFGRHVLGLRFGHFDRRGSGTSTGPGSGTSAGVGSGMRSGAGSVSSACASSGASATATGGE